MRGGGGGVPISRREASARSIEVATKNLKSADEASAVRYPAGRRGRMLGHPKLSIAAQASSTLASDHGLPTRAAAAFDAVTTVGPSSPKAKVASTTAHASCLGSESHPQASCDDRDVVLAPARLLEGSEKRGLACAARARQGGSRHL